MLNLYLITRVSPADYDEAAGFVVAAEYADEARELIVSSGQFGGEGGDAWLSERRTTLQLLGVADSEITEPQIISRDFHNG